MNTKFELILSNVGFAMFDPTVLQNFIASKSLPPNVFDYFIDEPTIGDEAVKSGIVLPVYSIPALDYQILITLGKVSTVRKDWIKFTTNSFPFVVESGKVVVSDIDALLDWDYSFYNSINFTADKQPYNAFLVENGIYEITIVGFCEKEWVGSSPVNKGYEFLFHSVDHLVRVGENIDSDSTDYIVYGSIDE